MHKEWVVCYEAGGSKLYLAECEQSLWGDLWSDVFIRAVRFPTLHLAREACASTGWSGSYVCEVVYSLNKVIERQD